MTCKCGARTYEQHLKRPMGGHAYRGWVWSPGPGDDKPDVPRETLSATQAQVIYRKVVAHYEGQFAEDSGPELVHDWEKTWDSPAPIIPWAIVWQYGPDDWAVSVSRNDVIPRDMGYVEAATGHVLALYPTA